MRWVIAVVVIVLIMALLGWLRFDNQEGNPSIEMDTNRMQQDTQEVVDQAKDAVGASAGAKDGS